MLRPPISDAEWERLSLGDRHEVSGSIIQMLLADASRSLAAGLFDARSDRHLSRVQLQVDERGWDELVKIQNRALKAVLAVQAASAKRLAAVEGDGFPALSALTCFELPPTRPAP